MGAAAIKNTKLPLMAHKNALVAHFLKNASKKTALNLDRRH